MEQNLMKNYQKIIGVGLLSLIAIGGYVGLNYKTSDQIDTALWCGVNRGILNFQPSEDNPLNGLHNPLMPFNGNTIRANQDTLTAIARQDLSDNPFSGLALTLIPSLLETQANSLDFAVKEGCRGNFTHLNDFFNPVSTDFEFDYETESDVSFSCLNLEFLQAVGGYQLLFNITNNCESKVEYASWNLNIRSTLEGPIVASESILLFDLMPGQTKQESVFIMDLPEGEFYWEAIEDTIWD